MDSQELSFTSKGIRMTAWVATGMLLDSSVFANFDSLEVLAAKVLVAKLMLKKVQLLSEASTTVVDLGEVVATFKLLLSI